MIDNSKEYILCAAVKISGAGIYRVVLGRRHSDAIRALKDTGIEWEDLMGCFHTQGFMTSHGNFLTRREAYDVALECGQITGLVTEEKILVSEDLY
jgi:hypothetical protein